MCPDPVEVLESVVSTPRFAPYLQETGDVKKAWQLYLWNIRLCESLYPAFHCCEIALRNSVHSSLAIHLSNFDWLFDVRRLDNRERELVADVVKRLKHHGKLINSDNVICELTLGFWSTMFSGPYEKRYWLSSGLLRAVFPKAPRSSLKISEIHSRLNHLREFRNRVFHHERIWHRGDLKLVHIEQYKFSGWISSEWRAKVEEIDRFKSVMDNKPVF